MTDFPGTTRAFPRINQPSLITLPFSLLRFSQRENRGRGGFPAELRTRPTRQTRGTQTQTNTRNAINKRTVPVRGAQFACAVSHHVWPCLVMQVLSDSVDTSDSYALHNPNSMCAQVCAVFLHAWEMQVWSVAARPWLSRATENWMHSVKNVHYQKNVICLHFLAVLVK